jgi:hypothetical protein
MVEQADRQHGRGDASLVRLARDGDREAFGELVLKYQGAACATAVGLLGNTDHPEAVTQRVTESEWQQARGKATFEHTSLYPEISAGDAAIRARLAASCVHATRISIVREQVDDIVLPGEAYTESLRRVFSPNFCGAGQILHGPRGHVDLVVGVPVGKTITILSASHGSNVRVRELRSNVNIASGACVEIEDVEGDVCLLQAQLKSARRIRGGFRQTYYGIGAWRWGQALDETSMGRLGPCQSVLRDICGDVHVDVACVDLQASDLSGQAWIRNRFGTTRFYQNRHEPADKCCIESDSGHIRVFLKEELIGEVDVTVLTLCGTVTADALTPIGSLNQRNDSQLAMLSTLRPSGPGLVPPEFLEADTCIKTRNGDVTIEKTV